MLVNAGIAQAAVSQLRLQDIDFRNYTVKLAINLTKTPPQRQRFLSAGTISISSLRIGVHEFEIMWTSYFFSRNHSRSDGHISGTFLDLYFFF